MSTSMVNCPYCGKLTDPNLESCVHCGGFLKKGGPGKSERAQGRTQTCPNCGAVVQQGDIICVACGTNLLTGQKIAAETPVVVETERSRAPWLIGAVVVLALVAVGVAGFFLLRDPVARAERLAERGDVSEATERLQYHVQRDPEDARAHFALGKLLWRQNQYEPAAKAFASAARLENDNQQAHLMAALSYAALNDPENQNRAVAALDDLVENAPDDAEAWHLLALARGAQGDAEAQVKAAQQADRRAPQDPEVDTALGVGYALQGDYRAAQQALRADGNDSPDETAARALVARLETTGVDAEAALRQAAQQPSHIRQQTLVQLGMSLLEQGRAEEAADALREANNLNKSDPAARFFLALALAELGLEPEALTEFEALAGGDSSFAAAAGVEHARLLLGRGEIDAALNAVDRAIQFGASGPVVQTIRGRIYARSSDTSGASRAREAFRAAVQADPDYAPAHLELGLLNVRLGMVEDGIGELEEYLDRVDPNLPDARVDQVKDLVAQLRRSQTTDSPAAGAGNQVAGGTR